MSKQDIRVAPHNDEAERSTIGAALIDNGMIQQLAALLDPQDFYREGHRHLWRAIVTLHERGEVVDVITLSDQLHAAGLLEAVGGPNAILGLSREVPSAANATYYALIIKRKAQLRAFIAASHAQIEAAYEDLSGEEHDAWCARTASALTGLLVAQHGSDTAHHAADFTKALAAHIYHGAELGPRWDTPFPSFNAALDGGRFEAGQLIVVGARPGGGKTAWALQVALHNALAGHNSLFFSMEMMRVQLALRMLACHARVDAPIIKARSMNDRQWTRIVDSLQAIRDARIWVDERTSLTLAHIEAECARLAGAGHPPAIVVVDYLQLVRPPTHSPNKADQLDLIAQGLHEIAQRQRCVVIALAQLNRSSGASEGSPGQGSFKGSGGIEAAADVALVLWREESSEDRDKKSGADGAPARHDAGGPVSIKAAIVKNRSGSIGPLEFNFHGAQYRFEDPTAEDDR